VAKKSLVGRIKQPSQNYIGVCNVVIPLLHGAEACGYNLLKQSLFTVEIILETKDFTLRDFFSHLEKV